MKSWKAFSHLKYIVSLTSRLHLQGVSKMQNKMKLNEAKWYRKSLLFALQVIFSFLSVVVFSIIKMWCATWHIKPHKNESSERISSHLKKLIFTHTKKKMKCLLRVEARRRAGNFPHDTFCKQNVDAAAAARGKSNLSRVRTSTEKLTIVCDARLRPLKWSRQHSRSHFFTFSSHKSRVELVRTASGSSGIYIKKEPKKKDMKTTAKPSKAAQEEV